MVRRMAIIWNIQNLGLSELQNAETLPGIYDPGRDGGYYDAWNNDGDDDDNIINNDNHGQRVVSMTSGMWNDLLAKTCSAPYEESDDDNPCFRRIELSQQ